MDTEKITYSVKEAAEALGVGTNQVYDLVKVPGFPVIRIGKRYLISKDGLREWIQAQIER